MRESPSTAPPLDGGDLPERTTSELDALAPSLSVVGRISPEGKRRVVESLRRSGRYVAMIGDGVNDVPALKASRLSVAQGSGTQMAKAVADIVLVTATSRRFRGWSRRAGGSSATSSA